MDILYIIGWLAAGFAGFVISVYGGHLIEADIKSPMLKSAYYDTLKILRNWRKFIWFIIPTTLFGLVSLFGSLVILMFGSIIFIGITFDKIKKSID